MFRKQVWAWALYDWANSAFATIVMAGFFPIVFKQYWAQSLQATDSTFYLGLANSISSLIIVVLAPVIGAMADQGGARKQFLVVFTALGILTTSCFYFVIEGQWLFALILYIWAVLGFMGGNIFYDALLPVIAEEEEYDTVSSLGFALGYIGGGILLALCVLITIRPEFFGINASPELARYSFIATALWWFVFSIPLLLFVKEKKQQKSTALEIGKRGIRQLWETISYLKRDKVIITFLCAYWLYIDGVDTIIRMAVDYGLALGFSSNSLIIALLVTQFVGFPATLFFGWLGNRYSPKFGIIICIWVYMLITLWAYFMDQVWEFYGLAIAVGLVQGGVQALSRSLYARLIPKHSAAEFFGFYNMMGKFAAVIGPLLVGGVSLLSGSSRLSILAVLILFVPGLYLLSKVRYEITPSSKKAHI